MNVQELEQAMIFGPQSCHQDTYSKICCIKGPCGPPGCRGKTGPTGERGCRGNSGPTGSNGPTGRRGCRGKTGPTGLQGPTGLRGIQGVTGPTGQRGIDGVTGSTGERGIDGVTGSTGERGIDGVTGSTGERGIDGVTGPTGQRGIDGVTGPTGERGIDGVTGPTGQRGIDGVTGPTGLTGERGLDGVTGPTGLSGIDGPTGPTGLSGIDGPTGPTGLSGIDGVTGPTGERGFDGVTGPTGDRGETGPGFGCLTLFTGTINPYTQGVVLLDCTGTNFMSDWIISRGQVSLGPPIVMGPESSIYQQNIPKYRSIAFSCISTLDVEPYIRIISMNTYLYTLYFTESFVIDMTPFNIYPSVTIVIASEDSLTGNLTITDIQAFSSFDCCKPYFLPINQLPSFTGPTGPQGLQGDPGPQGLQGDPGPQGPTGPQGDSGATGPCCTGPTGPTGIKGLDGVTGPTGYQVPQINFVYKNTNTFSNVTGNTSSFTPTNYNVIPVVGTGMNAVTGVFTAPIRGLYLFTVQMHMNGIGTTHTNGYIGISDFSGIGIGIFERFYPYNMAALNDFIEKVFTTLRYMQSGDTATPILSIGQSGQQVNVTFSSFSGCLLSTV